MSENMKKRKIQKGGSSYFATGLEGVKKSLISPVAGPNAIQQLGMQAKYAGSEVASDVQKASPLGKLAEKLEKNKSEKQKAKEKYAKTKDGVVSGENIRIFGEPEFWDLLYDEPCWIDPQTGIFELTGTSKLWNKWFIAEDIKEVVEELVSGSPNTDEKFDVEKAEEIFKSTYKDESGLSKYRLDRDFSKIIDKITGGQLTYHEALDKLEIAGSAEEIITKKENVAEAVTSGEVPAKVEDAAELEGKIGKSKWYFCFIFKFLMGPAGPLLLKLMPYFFKFLYTIIDTFSSLFKPFGVGDPNKYYFKKDGETPEKYEVPQYKASFFGNGPALWYTICTYFGTVLPLGKINHDWGKIYGNGKFGKLIFSMATVSFGIILLGYVSVFVFLLVFALYCGKTVSMFGDNIDEQKKK
jgi:hypothetical protein